MNIGRAGSPFDLADVSGTRPLGLDGGANVLNLPIDQMFGLNLVAPLTEKAQLNLAYLWLDSNTVGALNSVTSYNRVTVFGGDLKVDLDPIKIEGGYAATNLMYNQHNVIDNDNYAWWVKGDYKAEKFGLNAGYKEIQPNFAAPGDWGRIGTWWNPVQIKGFTVGGNFDLTDTLNLKATGEWYTGIDNVDGASLQSDDKINRYTVGVGYKLNTNWNLDLGWEYVQYDLQDRLLTFTGGKPVEQWYNIGLNYGFSSNAKLSVLWQISDYDAKGVIPFEIGGTGRYTGGLLTTQLSVKF
jgi:predicted porin